MSTKDDRASEAAEPKPEPKAERRTPTLDRVVALLTALKAEGGEVFPMRDERIIQIIGEPTWIKCVHEAHSGGEKLDDHTALGTRPKAFDV